MLGIDRAPVTLNWLCKHWSNCGIECQSVGLRLVAKAARIIRLVAFNTLLAWTDLNTAFASMKIRGRDTTNFMTCTWPLRG